MTLFANEYSDIWQFSDECPSPMNYPTWADADVRVHEFVDIFLKPQFFGKIIIWEHKNWFTRHKVGKMENGFCVLDYLPEAEMVQLSIESYNKTGHLSILFIPLEPKLFLSEILKSKHYKKPCKIEIGTGKSDEPFCCKDGYDFSFIESLVSTNDKRIFTFSHDAEFLYEIFR